MKSNNNDENENEMKKKNEERKNTLNKIMVLTSDNIRSKRLYIIIVLTSPKSQLKWKNVTILIP